MNYQDIKAYAKALKTSVKSLIALGEGNDPFYCGTPSHCQWANWVGEHWRSLGMGEGTHIRALHYRLVSQQEPVIMPDGDPYLNTEKCWKHLTKATKWARYLGIIPLDNLADRRAPDPKLYFREESWLTDRPSSEIEKPWQLGLGGIDFNFPEWQEPPAIVYQKQDHRQTYHLELWCEKSTMNSILDPLCRRHEMALQTGVGEISITRCLELVKRARESKKPVRIFYISDFDPAGQSMPVAAARKIEWAIAKSGEVVDIKLYALALTEDQVRLYNLPKTPIKETERRATAFEDRYGEGAVELDALEALYPGSLRQIIEAAIAPYLETERANRVGLSSVNRANATAVEAVNEAVMSLFEEDWQILAVNADALKQEMEAEARELVARFQDRFERLRDARKEIQTDIEARLKDLTPIIEAYQPTLMDNEPPALMDSQRDYLGQLRIYKNFQAKTTPPPPNAQIELGLDIAA